MSPPSLLPCCLHKEKDDEKRVGSSLPSFVYCFVSCLLWQNKNTTQAWCGIVGILVDIDVIQMPQCDMRSREDVRENETLHQSRYNNTILCIQEEFSVGLQLTIIISRD